MTIADTFSPDDARFMRRALDLSVLARGMVSPNPMVGAVIVKDGKIIGEGYHRCCGESHAEVDAFNNTSEDTTGATIYVTLEPCSHFGKTPPCAPLIVEKKIRRVVIAHTDPNPLVSGKGIEIIEDAGIKVEVGLLEQEARLINEHFLTYYQLKRPFIISKWAMTLDGRIASMSGESRWISNEKSRLYVHEIRSNVDAVMVGIGTVLQDNPLLNVRLTDYRKRQPKRIIVDGSLRIPRRAACLVNADPGQCIIATSVAAPSEKIDQLRQDGHHVIVLPGNRGLLDLRQLMGELYPFKIQSVLCEGGSNLHGSLLETKLVDKVIAFIAPKIVGGYEGNNPVLGWGLPTMNEALTLDNPQFIQFDTDVCIEAYMNKANRDLKPLKVKNSQRASTE